MYSAGTYTSRIIISSALIKINKKIKTLLIYGFMVYNCSMEINKPIILASGSPRRLEIMRKHGYDPLVIPADVDETVPDGIAPPDVPVYLAELKAEAVASGLSIDDGLIISADTIVYLGELDGNGEIMGKPHDAEDGFRMLSSLRNRHHYVITGVCIIDLSSNLRRSFSEVTKVTFTDISDRELHEYLLTDEAYDKAGGYAIQGTFGKYIESFEGSYENVVGFPWDRIKKEIENL